MSDPRALSDELLAQAGWLRALARGLVRDADAAEDLVQESLVRALERPPGARRVARESVAARPEAQPGADEIAALLERERALLELLVALGEPYRSALYLRYRDGLAPEEIARRRGTNPATVRSHVHRGLELLRAELARRFPGGRSPWCAWLAPILARLELRALVPVDAAGTSWSETVELAVLEVDGEAPAPDERWVYAWKREGLSATVALEPGATPREVRVPAGPGEIRRVTLGDAVEEGAFVRGVNVALGASERVVLLR